jgi:ribose 5-phosphate isomerase B
MELIMKIAIGSDHAGFELKESISEYLKLLGHEVEDFGQFDSEPADNYPFTAMKVSEAVVNGQADRGFLCCGTGIGMSIAANKVPGVRAALVNDLFSAKASREHNDSNILVVGARLISDFMAKQILDIWLNTAFSAERHCARVAKYAEIEKKYIS